MKMKVKNGKKEKFEEKTKGKVKFDKKVKRDKSEKIEKKLSVENNLVFKDLETIWYKNELSNDPKTYEITKDIEIVSKYRNRARLLFERDIAEYEKFREKTRRSDHNWIKTVLSSGTIADKISANSILIQDSAVHNLKSLDALISLVKVNRKRECLQAIDALKDIFVNTLLPNRPLKTFEERPFQMLEKASKVNEVEENQRLLLWYFEGILKIKYQNFIRAVQLVFQDTVAVTKTRLANTITELLIANKHEQEKFLIEILLNKLGDPDYKVASKILFHVKRLLTKRPQQRMETLLELERLIYRPNINQKAQYYGFCCMNQFALTRHDQDIANRLIVIYFSFFKKYIKNKEIDSRMLNAILTGVNRAYKYAKMNHEEIDNNLNTLFKIVHVTSFNVSIQALMLLNQVVETRDDLLNRYYNALYRKMFDLESKNTSKQQYFLNLLFKSISKDDAIPRIRAFAKRLLQVCFNQNVPFICGSLMLLSELMKTKPSLFQFDNNMIVHDSTNGEDNKKSNGALDADDEEERFVDVKTESTDDEREDGDDEEDKPKEKKQNGKRKKGDKTSWVHKNLTIHKTHDTYDYTQRNPLYSGADKTLTYELLQFSRHYHPTVAVFANKLMHGEFIDYGGNPMEDFNLMHFLERFVYKNPKKNQEKEIKTKKSLFKARMLNSGSSIHQIPINSKEYIDRDIKDIPEDEKFFYEYFKKQAEKKNIVDDLESEGSVSDTEFDEYLSKTENDGVAGDEDWGLDIADALSKNKKKTKKKKTDDDDEDDLDGFSDDDDDDEDEDDDFAKAMNDEDFGLDDELDELNELQGDEDEDGEDAFEDDAFDLGLKKGKGKNKSRKEADIGELFAAADEFSELIENSQKFEEKGLGHLSNRDNSDAKQLRWESNRFNDTRDFKKKKFMGKNKSKSSSFSKPGKKGPVKFSKADKKVPKGPMKFSKKPGKMANKGKKKGRFSKK